MGSIALFGEAEKGDFEAAYVCQSLEELSSYLGEPPKGEARGLFFAIQMLMYSHGVIFFRVHEEGFSQKDYIRGLQFLENKQLFPEIIALCLPGVGNKDIFDKSAAICQLHNSLLIITEKDLYDYLTDH